MSQASMVEIGSISNARKSLQFKEISGMEVSAELSKVPSGSISLEGQQDAGSQLGGDEVMKEATGSEDQEQYSALDDANLMVEGVLLSDSELLDEEWEEGEVPDFLEEIEDEPAAVGLGEASEPVDTSKGVKEDVGAKVA